jgi:4'-phosphopantetheinyl transferase
VKPALWLAPCSGGEAGRRNALLAFCATQLNVAPDRLALTHDEAGAPLLRLDGGPSAWRVSASSRENIALFGLSRERIGVDVEVLATMAPAWNVLHENERTALAALPHERQGEAFLRLWTAKEAYLKALGVGRRREPSEICIRARADVFEVLDGGREISASEGRLWRENVAGRVVLCACVTLPGK